jgi:nucleotide-binding universal stress UspA family protein
MVLSDTAVRYRNTRQAMTYRTIVSVINEHSGSTVTASYAIALATTTKARLVLYAAHPQGTGETILHHTERHLDHLFAVALDHDIAVTRITEVGLLTRLLPKRVLAENGDLVFYPLLPNEQYGAPLQRQNVHQLLRSIKADLAIMRIMHMGKPHPQHILVPLASGIPDLTRRVSFLALLAQSFHAQITLFHRHNDRGQKVPTDLGKVYTALKQQHLPVLERTGTGPTAKAIALEAISHHNDLIVLGASERSPLRRLFFGNPSGDVMHRPPCNAMLFRAVANMP